MSKGIAMPPTLLHADTPCLPVLQPGVPVLDNAQSVAHAMGTGALLEHIVEAEGETAWWAYGDFVLLARWRVVVEYGVN
jgi:hypothetical protein